MIDIQIHVEGVIKLAFFSCAVHVLLHVQVHDVLCQFLSWSDWLLSVTMALYVLVLLSKKNVLVGWLCLLPFPYRVLLPWSLIPLSTVEEGSVISDVSVLVGSFCKCYTVRHLGQFVLHAPCCRMDYQFYVHVLGQPPHVSTSALCLYSVGGAPVCCCSYNHTCCCCSWLSALLSLFGLTSIF